MGHKILHRKQKYKQWATKYYTEKQKTKKINNGPQNTTQKQKYKQWATKYYTENKNINNEPQNTTQKTKI